MQEHHTILIENLHAELMIPHLYSNQFLNWQQKQDIEALPSAYKKADYLITNVLRRSSTAHFKLFVQVCLQVLNAVTYLWTLHIYYNNTDTI